MTTYLNKTKEHTCRNVILPGVVQIKMWRTHWGFVMAAVIASVSLNKGEKRQKTYSIRWGDLTKRAGEGGLYLLRVNVTHKYLRPKKSILSLQQICFNITYHWPLCMIVDNSWRNTHRMVCKVIFYMDIQCKTIQKVSSCWWYNYTLKKIEYQNCSCPQNDQGKSSK